MVKITIEDRFGGTAPRNRLRGLEVGSRIHRPHPPVSPARQLDVVYNGDSQKYALDLLKALGMDVTHAKTLIERVGVGPYIDSRMEEAEIKAVELKGEGREVTGLASVLEQLVFVRDHDYQRRTPPGLKVVASDDGSGYGIK